MRRLNIEELRNLRASIEGITFSAERVAQQEREVLKRAERERQGRINRNGLVYGGIPGVLVGAAVADALAGYGSAEALIVGAGVGGYAGSLIATYAQELAHFAVWAKGHIRM